MLRNVWNRDYSPAGPEDLTRALFDTSLQILCSNYGPNFLRRKRGVGDVPTRYEYPDHPRIHFASDDDDSGAGFSSHLLRGTAFILGSNAGIDNSGHSDCHLAESPVMTDVEDSFAAVIPYPSFTSSSSLSHDPPLADFLSPILVSNLDDSSVPTAFCEELEDSSLDSSSSSLALSAYAPLPLPPIFTYESGSKVLPIPIDVSSSLSSWTADKENIDPFLGPSVQKSTAKTHGSSIHGSTLAELCLPISLPPVSLSSFPSQVCNSCSLEVREPSKRIPLELAKRQAKEFRATGTNVSLSTNFLMQFLGQPLGQTKWHCYIQDCEKQLTRKGHMLDHVRMHLGERSFACDQCPQTFLRKADCKRHAATHNPNRGFKCDFCPKTYARKDLLTRHTRICRPTTGGGSDGPTKKTNRHRKRRGIYTDRAIKSESTYELFVSPDMLSLRQWDSKRDKNIKLWQDYEENKENIDPSLLPSASATTF